MSEINVAAAVAAALCCDWKKAKEINSKLLSQNPEDIDCLNRLGKACLELGDNKKAASYFRKVLKINRYDPIATKNLARATSAPANKKTGNVAAPVHNNQHAFIEEPGVTKLVTLVNLAPAKTLLGLNYGDAISLTPKRHTIIVCDQAEHYVGALPDDIAHRLLFLIKGGNTYEGYIKSISRSVVSVFIKETLRAKKYHNTPSFIASNSSAEYLSFVREDAITEEVKVVEPSEDSDEDDDTTASKRTKTYLDEEVDRDEV